MEKKYLKSLPEISFDDPLNDKHELNILSQKLKHCLDFQYISLSIVDDFVEFFIKNKFSENKENHYKIFITSIVNLTKKLFNYYKKDNSDQNYYKLVNITITFMIIVINCKKLKSFIESVLSKDGKILNLILEISNWMKSHDANRRVDRIIGSLISDEYRRIFQENKLSELYRFNLEKIKKNIDISNIKLSNEIYERMFDYLSFFDVDYDTLFKYKTINEKETPLIKSIFVQSLIRIVFSNEKTKYLRGNTKFEFDFLQFITRTCMSRYRESNGDKVSGLFRRDNLIEDTIKNILFLFGTSFIFHLYIDASKKAFEENGDVPDKFLLEDKFIGEFEEFLSKLLHSLPFMIKFILRIIHESVLEFFNIDKNNYKALFTSFFFNFAFSPKLQEILGLSPTKHQFIMNINRIIRNVCFNENFLETEPLSRYNEFIEYYHPKINDTFEKILASVGSFNEKMFAELNNQYLNYPEFLFYYDSAYILEFLKELDDFPQFSALNGIKIKRRIPREFSLRTSLVSEEMIDFFEKDPN